MKIQVLILFFASLIYVQETIQLPLVLLHNSKVSKTCCMKTNAAKSNSCGQKKPKTRSQLPGCNELNCSNCPYAYISTFQPVLVFGHLLSPAKAKYPVIAAHWLAGYCNESWKPPDTI